MPRRHVWIEIEVDEDIIERRYTIDENGTITSCCCSECTELDPDIDEEEINEVIEILEEALSKLKERAKRC